jgi:2-keto-4-pentenoate hydratase/2-oxohepta-3-ene-1,7-dioic acid hydratase in catechol pathway
MRIIRFAADDGRVLLGEDHLDGTATVLLDADGILGPTQREQAYREIIRGKRALVADDDEGIRQAICATLGKLECECTICKDGAEAMAAIDERELDVIVSDIVMPHHNGYEVFAAARRRSEQLAVVLITGFGYDPNHSILRACNEGCEAVLYKPFTPQQLMAKMSEAIRATTNGVYRPLVRTAERIRAGTPLAPLIPHDVLCAGRNYGDEGGGELELFMKPRGAVQDPGKPIVIPKGIDDPQLDCEGELAVVIGSTAQQVSEAAALEHILGYVAANDVTARYWQRAVSWMRGKGFDTFCPVGPAIVTPDELGDPDALTITTSVNGRVVRRGSTDQMLRPVARLISEVSARITLPPGTLLLTGAPPRIEASSPAGLRHGDEVCVDIDRIGQLVNPVHDA